MVNNPSVIEISLIPTPSFPLVPSIPFLPMAFNEVSLPLMTHVFVEELISGKILIEFGRLAVDPFLLEKLNVPSADIVGKIVSPSEPFNDTLVKLS